MAERIDLNQIDNFKIFKQNLNDIDLQKAKIITPEKEDINRFDKSNLAKEAKNLGYDPNNLDLSSPKDKALAIKNDLGTAKSFGEMDGKLSKNDLWIDKKNNGLVFTDGFTSVKATEINSDFNINQLKKNFGEEFSKYIEVRNNGIDTKGAESRVQAYFDQENVKDLKSTRGHIKNQLKDVRYELAAIQTSPKATRNTSRKETLLLQKTELIKDHKNLSAEIASLEKRGRYGTGVDRIKSQINHIKSKAGRIGESANLAKEGYKINKRSLDGMQSARKVIGMQGAFSKKVAESTNLPSKFKSLKTVGKPALSVAYKAYSAFSRIANDPERTR